MINKDNSNFTPTPTLSHFCFEDYDNIYEPAEDTFLFLDALEKDIDYIKIRNPFVCVEIGVGSGTVITFLANLLSKKTANNNQSRDIKATETDDVTKKNYSNKNNDTCNINSNDLSVNNDAKQTLSSNCLYFGIDINSKAVEGCVKTVKANHQNLEHWNFIRADLFSGLRLKGLVDILLFNPPYVVTPSEEVGSKDIVASWAGGLAGREVTDRLLPIIHEYLSENGIFYLIVIPENKPNDISEILAAQGFIHCKEILARRRYNEQLSVLRYSRHP